MCWKHLLWRKKLANDDHSKTFASLAGLPVIPGLDTAQALLRVAGNRTLYLKLLRRFASEYGLAAAEIAAHLQAGDRDSAGRVAHTVRGVAANLGAIMVQAAAARLEAALHGDATPAQLDGLVLQFDGELTPFVERLRAALGEHERAPVVMAAPTNPELRDAVVAQMHQHLAEFDAAASDCLEAHRDLFAALFPGHEFGLFAQRVQDYAFTEALVQLQQAAPAAGLQGG